MAVRSFPPRNLPALGKYFSTAHCMVSLYKSVSSKEKIPSGTDCALEAILVRVD